MDSTHETSRVDTVIIGAGQSGLSVAYYLKRAGVPFAEPEADHHLRVTP